MTGLGLQSVSPVCKWPHLNDEKQTKPAMKTENQCQLQCEVTPTLAHSSFSVSPSSSELFHTVQFERKVVVVISDMLAAAHAQTHFSHPLASPVSASGEGSAQEGVSS